MARPIRPSRPDAIGDDNSPNQGDAAGARDNPLSEQDQYALIAEHTSDLVALFDRRGRFVYASPSYQRVLGLDPAALAGTDIFNLVHPGDTEFVRRQGKRLVRAGRGEISFRHRHADGSWRWLEARADIVERAGDLYAVGVMRDITERRAATEALRHSEAKFRRLADANIVGVIIADFAGQIVDANDAFLTMLGFTRAELTSGAIRWRDLTPPEYLPQDERIIDLLRRDGDAPSFEKEYLHKDGSRVPVLLGVAMLDRDEGTTICYVLDLSGRKRAEAALSFLAEASSTLGASLDYTQTLSNLVRLAVPRLADACVLHVAEPDGPLRPVEAIHVNQRKRDQFRKIVDLYPPDPAGGTPGAQVLRSGAPILVAEVDLDTLPGITRDVDHLAVLRALDPRSLIVVPVVVFGQTAGILTLVISESERRYTPDDLAVAQEFARRAAHALENARLYDDAREAIRVRDQFFSIAAHELRTPVTSILGNAQLLERRTRRDGTLSERDQRTVAIIAGQAGRLSRMIGGLLDLSRTQGGQLSLDRAPVDLQALVRRVIDELQPTLHRHAVECVGVDGPLIVDGDELRLEQVVQNLIQNAIKYSPEGGQVTVRVEPRDGWAVLSVADAGIGIPADALPHLFERFYRAGNAGGQGIGGMGLGLYVVKEIVTLHGGAIEVASVEGQGSAFTVTLPLA